MKKNKSTLSIKKEELARSLQSYNNLDEQLKKFQIKDNEFVQILIKNGIPQTDVFSYKIDTTKISTLMGHLAKEITDIDALLDIEREESKTNG